MWEEARALIVGRCAEASPSTDAPQPAVHRHARASQSTDAPQPAVHRHARASQSTDTPTSQSVHRHAPEPGRPLADQVRVDWSTVTEVPMPTPLMRSWSGNWRYTPLTVVRPRKRSSAVGYAPSLSQSGGLTGFHARSCACPEHARESPHSSSRLRMRVTTECSHVDTRSMAPTRVMRPPRAPRNLPLDFSRRNRAGGQRWCSSLLQRQAL
jgi:hypothetical protein